jgi:general secretion pathway protein G
MEGAYMKEKSRRKIAIDCRGFSLIEMLVVMIIIGLLAALVGPRLFGKVGTARRQATKAQITMLGTALDAFRLDVGRYPETGEGLDALRVAPGGIETWDGPYIDKEIPKDPWKNDYVYFSPGEHGEYDLMSYGADGAQGGEKENKDIVSWAGL